MGLVIAQSLCVIQLCVQMGSSCQAVGELHKVTVLLRVLILNLPIQCGAAMVGPVQLDAPGHVMSTTSSMQQGQAVFRKRVLQIVRGLYKIQTFWLGLREHFPLVSISATLGILDLAPP